MYETVRKNGIKNFFHLYDKISLVLGEVLQLIHIFFLNWKEFSQNFKEFSPSLFFTIFTTKDSKGNVSKKRKSL